MKLFTISLLVVQLLGIGAYAQTDIGTVKINLGKADQFALLGGSGITNVSAHTFIRGRWQLSDTHSEGNQARSGERPLVSQVQPGDGRGLEGI